MKDPKFNFDLDSPLIPNKIKEAIKSSLPPENVTMEDHIRFMNSNHPKLQRFLARIRSEEARLEDDEKINIVLDYLKVIFSKEIIENINLDIAFEKPEESEEGGEIEMKRFREPIEYDKNLRLSVHRRRIANLIMQGKALLSVNALSKPEKPKLSNEQIDNYKGFMKSSQDMHKTSNDRIHNIVASNTSKKGSGEQGMPFGYFEIKWEGESPILFARGNNILLLIHEVTKGIYELGFMEQLSQYDVETLKKIYKQADTMQDEQIGFKYSEAFVTILENIFRRDIEIPLYGSNKIDKIYDDNDMFLLFWSSLYNPKHLSDELFGKLFYNWLDDNLKEDEMDSLKNLYLNLYQKHKINKEILPNIEDRYSINDLLDKIVKFGINSLTINERVYLNNQSDLI